MDRSYELHTADSTPLLSATAAGAGTRNCHAALESQASQWLNCNYPLRVQQTGWTTRPYNEGEQFHGSLDTAFSRREYDTYDWSRREYEAHDWSRREYEAWKVPVAPCDARMGLTRSPLEDRTGSMPFSQSYRGAADAMSDLIASQAHSARLRESSLLEAQSASSCIVLGFEPAVGFTTGSRREAPRPKYGRCGLDANLMEAAQNYPGVPIVSLTPQQQAPSAVPAPAMSLNSQEAVGRQHKKQNKLRSVDSAVVTSDAKATAESPEKPKADEDKDVATGPPSEDLQSQTASCKIGTLELPKVALLVAYFPRSASASELRRVFEAFGEVAQAYIVRGKDGASKCYGFICFVLPEKAESALQSCEAGKVIMSDSKGKAWHVKASWAKNAAPLQRTRQAQKMSKKGLLVVEEDGSLPESPTQYFEVSESDGNPHTDGDTCSTISSSASTVLPSAVASLSSSCSSSEE